MIDAFGMLKIRLLGGQNELKFYAKTLFIINQVLLLSFLCMFCLYFVLCLFGFGSSSKEMCCRSSSGDVTPFENSK